MARGKVGGKPREGSAVSSTLALPAAATTVDVQTRRELSREMTSRRVRQSDTVGRRRFGANTDMISIASAIENANCGLMADICDLESEVLTLDPHLASCASKRLGALQAADWDVTPPHGVTGTDRPWAAKIASETKRMLENVSITDALFDTSWGLYDGRSALEWNWASGAWGMKIAPYGYDWIHPRRLSFGAERELRVIDPYYARAFDSSVGVCVEELPGKFMFWKPRLFREHHEREGLGPRSLYWSFFKRFGWRLRMRLTELFAIPWRIIELDEENPANEPGIEGARREIDELSGDTSAVMPAGTKLRIEWPGDQSGDLFGKSHEDCNAETSKIWLGNTATTQQGNGSRAEGIIGKGEEDILFQRDGNGLSRRPDGLIRTFVRLNFGDAAIHLVPKFQIRTAPQRDRDKEGARAKLAMSMGLTIAESDLREMFGIRAPAPDEKFFRMGAGGVDQFGNPTAGAIEVVDPQQKKSSDGDQPSVVAKPDVQMTPTDLAVVITVNEARASANLPPLDGPDGDLTLAEFKAKHADTIAEGEAAIDGVVAPGGTGKPEPEAKPEPDEREPTAERADDDVEDRGVDGQAEDAAKSLLGLSRGYAASPVCCAAQAGLTVPASAVYGSPEVLVERGVKEGARASSAWAASLAAAVDGLSDAVSIRRAIDATELDVEAFAKAVERRLVHGAMLGALDADWEAENDRVVKPPAFAISNDGSGREIEESEPMRLARYGIDPTGGIRLQGGVKDFVASPFQEAIRIFKARNVVTRRAFDRLAAQAKQRAFTVANMASRDVIGVVKDELTKALEDGDDLRRFSARLAERTETAGWVAANPSHVENVFRTNTMGAYARGREEQMNQPSVLAARPYRQLMGVKDSRTRPFHRAAHGKVLHHTDAAVPRLRTPLGFMCRCRWVSRSAADVERLGLEVVSGASLSGLPDEGWDGPGGF